MLFPMIKTKKNLYDFVKRDFQASINYYQKEIAADNWQKYLFSCRQKYLYVKYLKDSDRHI